MRYEIKGETLPVVICYLDAGEKIITENGGMSWMSPNMEMKTSSNGGIGKMFGRMFSGEKMFQNIYTATLAVSKLLTSILTSFPHLWNILRIFTTLDVLK